MTREYLTLHEAQEMLSLGEKDILYFASEGHIKLSCYLCREIAVHSIVTDYTEEGEPINVERKKRLKGYFDFDANCICFHRKPIDDDFCVLTRSKVNHSDNERAQDEISETFYLEKPYPVENLLLRRDQFNLLQDLTKTDRSKELTLETLYKNDNFSVELKACIDIFSEFWEDKPDDMKYPDKSQILEYIKDEYGWQGKQATRVYEVSTPQKRKSGGQQSSSLKDFVKKSDRKD